MKVVCIILFIFLALYTAAQNYEECTRKDLPRTKTSTSLKGSISGDTTFINPNKLKEGIELEISPVTNHIIGYYVAVTCEGCDIITVPVCGSKMENKFFDQIKNSLQKDYILEFYRINVEINGKRFLAPEFMVNIKE